MLLRAGAAELTPNRLILCRDSILPGFATEVIRMPTVHTVRLKPVLSIVPGDAPALSDDECLSRLAQVIKAADSADLDEVARLIARLAVTIE
jgi:hypothetical protein